MLFTGTQTGIETHSNGHIAVRIGCRKSFSIGQRTVVIKSIVLVVGGHTAPVQAAVDHPSHKTKRKIGVAYLTQRLVEGDIGKYMHGLKTQCTGFVVQYLPPNSNVVLPPACLKLVLTIQGARLKRIRKAVPLVPVDALDPDITLKQPCQRRIPQKGSFVKL